MAAFFSAVPPCGCVAEAERELMPQRITRVVTHERLGVIMEVPADWVQKAEGSALVFSGPADSASYYTPLVLQGSPRSSATLGQVLQTTHASVMTRKGAAWTWREPTVVAGRPAVRYGLQLELHETPRRKAGVLVDSGTAVIDLSYAAPTELFALSLDAFEQAVDTLELFAPAVE